MKQITLKKTKIIELNEAYKKILYLFFSFPTKEISLNDLVRYTKISKTTANKTVKRLAREDFLRINKIGKLWRITCNQEHEYNTTKKIAYNLELLYDSGIIDEILKLIPNPRTIILFGSYRKGDDIDSSDIDIAVDVTGEDETKIFELGTLPQFGYRHNVKVHVLKFTRKKIDLNLFANIVNGIILFGFLEARP